LTMDDHRTFIYILKKAEYYKIGISCNPYKRLVQIDVDSIRVSLISFYGFEKRSDAELFEKMFHSIIERWNVRGEWFKLSVSQLQSLHLFLMNCCPTTGCEILCKNEILSDLSEGQLMHKLLQDARVTSDKYEFPELEYKCEIREVLF
jgi:hypothetical protein